MSTTTTNLSLVKPALTDNADITVINTNMDLIDTAVAAKETPTGAQTKATTAQTNAEAYTDNKAAAIEADFVRLPGYAVDTGTANHLIVTLSPVPTSYIDGMGVVVKVKYASTIASDINVNGLGVKAIYDSLGNAVTNFRANTTYSMKYESISGNFIAQGKGSGGNVTASELLTGITATSDTGPVTGTMPNNGAVAITPSNASQAIVAGYHNGLGSVSAVTVPAANVLTGTTIAGTAGTMPENGALGTYVPSASPQTIPAGHTSGGTVAAVVFTASKLLAGTTVAGTAGTMTDKTASATTITPSASIQAIPQGYYPGGTGDGKVSAVTVNAAHLLTGDTIAGTAGTMPNNASPTATITTQGGTKVVPAGYSPGGTIIASFPDNGSQAATITTQGGTKVVPAGYTSTGGTVTASLPVKTNTAGTQYAAGTAGVIYIYVPGGYWDGTQVTFLSDANFTPANLIGTVFGLAGTYPVNPSNSSAQWTTPGTYQWTVPPGVNRILAGLFGAGAGGGGASGFGDYGGGGGGGGGYGCAFVGVTPGSSITVIVGSGGTGGAAAPTGPGGTGTAGNAGGSTSFGSLSIPSAGAGGGGTTSAGGAGGSAGSFPSISSLLYGFLGAAGTTGVHYSGSSGGGAGGPGSAGSGYTGGSDPSWSPGPAGGNGGAGGSNTYPGGTGGTGSSPGGGAGGGGCSNSSSYANGQGGIGGPGAVYIKW